jgi:hypothetical protein
MIRGSSGTILQSLDVLDFSVLHLSAYERALRKHARYTKTLPPGTIPSTIETMQHLSDHLRPPTHQPHTVLATNTGQRTSDTDSRGAGQRDGTRSTSISRDQNRTLVMMPFLGTGMGSGHSVLANRFVYLHACFWSLFAHWPHIVVGVTSVADYNYCR